MDSGKGVFVQGSPCISCLDVSFLSPGLPSIKALPVLWTIGVELEAKYGIMFAGILEYFVGEGNFEFVAITKQADPII